MAGRGELSLLATSRSPKWCFVRRLAAALLLASSAAWAGSDSPSVARVGDGKISAKELEERLFAMPSFERLNYGFSPEEVRRNYLQKVMIPELLYDLEARRRKIEERALTRDRVSTILRRALEQRVRTKALKERPLSAVDIKRYYDEHKDAYVTPLRIKIWRIVVREKSEGQELLGRLRKGGLVGVGEWSQAARKSLDKATRLRDGNLGFVRPDGRTDTPQVRVDPALFAAAQKVKDGEFVQQPVKEGEHWAVIWRRGSLKPVTRTLLQEEKSIRKVLMRKRGEEALDELLEKLNSSHVRGKNAELLSFIEVDPMGDLGARKRPGIVPRGKGRGKPKRGERGLR